MKNVLNLSKYIVFLFVLMFGMSVGVSAADMETETECIYQYGVEGGSDVSALKFRILENGNAKGIITAFGGESTTNLETNTNWDDSLLGTYQKNKQCPKYAMVAKNFWGYHVYVSYNKDYLDSVIKSENYENYFIEPLITSNEGGTLTDHTPDDNNQNLYTSEELENIDKEDKEKEDKENTTIQTGSEEGCEALEPLMEDIQLVWDMIKIAAPILVVVFGSIDFFQAVIASDDKQMKTATTKFSKRLMLAAAIFFIPYVIEVLFAISGLDQTITSAVCGIR